MRDNIIFIVVVFTIPFLLKGVDDSISSRHTFIKAADGRIMVMRDGFSVKTFDDFQQAREWSEAQ